jgi:putative DNA primase/helicase
MTIDDLLMRLDRVAPERPGQWNCQCPGHDDSKNSLAVSVTTDGTILMKCQAGCSTADLLAAKGLTMRDLFPPKQTGRNGKRSILATYDYRDETKLLLYQAVRFDPKGFAQRTPDLTGGWEWKLNGARRVPFRLPQLMEADPAAFVFIPEGEKDVLTLAALGLTATTNVGGAGKWRDDYNEFLKGRNVVILPDNDKPGREHAQLVAKSLHGNAASVKILELDGLPDKGDVSDWIAAGGTKETLIELAQAASEWMPHAATVQKPPRQSRRSRRPTPPNDGDPLSPFHDEGQTDLSNARRFVAMHGQFVRFCAPQGVWYVWNGRQWREDDTGEVYRLAKQVPDAIFKAALAFGDDDTFRFAVRSASARGIEAMLKLAESEPGIAVVPEQFDAHPWLLNCVNGVLNLRTGELGAHDPALYLSKLCQTAYDPDAANYEFEKCLDKIFDGRQPLIDFLRRLIGYCLTGQTTEQILPILFGGGSNGKSLLLKLFILMLGNDYAMTANRELLIGKKGEVHPTELASLFGKRLVVSIETDDGHQLAEGMVKQLTGGDRIRARRMREDFWEFDATFKVLLCTNHKPEIRGDDHAIWRRIALLPFDVRFWNADAGESGPPELQADKGLFERLQTELPGVLAWAVCGCLEWQRDGLRMPDEVRQATKEYRNSEDVLAAFLAEKCLTMPGVKVRTSQLYQVFREWCKETGETDRGQRKFGMAMTAHGFTRLRSTGEWYQDVALTAEAEREANQD